MIIMEIVKAYAIYQQEVFRHSRPFFKPVSIDTDSQKKADARDSTNWIKEMLYRRTNWIVKIKNKVVRLIAQSNSAEFFCKVIILYIELDVQHGAHTTLDI